MRARHRGRVQEHSLGPGDVQQHDRGPGVHLLEPRPRVRRSADRDPSLVRGAFVGIRLVRRRGTRASSSPLPASSSSGSRSRSSSTRLRTTRGFWSRCRSSRIWSLKRPAGWPDRCGSSLLTGDPRGQRARVGFVGVSVAALAALNLAIAWDFIEDGPQNGEAIGTTGRYVESRRDVPGKKFYLVRGRMAKCGYYSFGNEHSDRIAALRARGPGRLAGQSG